MPPIDLAARIDAAVAAIESPAPDAGAEGGAVPVVETSTEAPAGQTPSADGAPVVEQTPEQIEHEKTLAAKRAVIEEKLAAQRERRQAAKLQAQAEADRRAAAEARTAAESERAKYDALKKGTFKETIEKLGLDPRAVFEEMQHEAIEASTPEAEMKRMRADFEKQMGEKLKPLQETIEELRREREATAAQANHLRLVNAFQSTVVDPAYVDLRAEYGDEGILAYVQGFVRDPQGFMAAAHAYNVPLTDPSQGFTMREILDVLKSAQDAHDRGKQERRQKLLPASPPGQTQPSKPHTVNGTAARSNAGTPIGNDLADERAAPPRKLSRKERIQAEIDRLAKG